MTRVSLSSSFDLPLARRAAFRLFTARGERLWVPGWSPEFFADVGDDLDEGTVWRTRDDQGRATTWIVIASDRPYRVGYARVAEAGTAGTVRVTIVDDGDGCLVTVAYDLTATTAAADAELAAFRDDYETMIASWREAILAHLAGGGSLPAPV